MGPRINSLESHKQYYETFQASLKKLFTQILDRTFLNLVKEFYLNVKPMRSSLRSPVREMEISLHKDHFEKTFELLTEGITYTINKPIGFKKF